MELYTLDGAFLRDAVLEDLVSVVWAERYVGEGDINIVLPSSKARVAQLAEGKFIWKKGSKVPMQIETQSIENGLMTVVGKEVKSFFNERYTVEQALSGKPGEIISEAVETALITAPFGGADDVIPFLVIGDVDISGVDVDEVISSGPVYDGVKPIAEKYKIGTAVYLEAGPFAYEFQFVTYTGLDRTSGQFENERVRFAPADDSMQNVKELRSVDGYKNVVYVIPPAWHTDLDPRAIFAPGFDPDTVGFERRVMVIDASDIDFVGAGSYAAAEVEMTKRGTDALANNNFTKVMDGEVIPQSFKYGTHYYLGDFVELVGQSGVPQRAQVTEYIHTLDGEGEKEHPTVSVVE